MKFSSLVLATWLLFSAAAVPVAAGDKGGGDRDDAKHAEWRREMQRAWNEEPTESELKDVADFMAVHSPRRWEAFNRLSEEHPEKDKLKKLILVRFRGVRYLKEREPRLYELRLKQVKLEDEAWDFSERYRASKDEAERARLREKVREQVASVVNLWMSERQYRIDLLEEEVEDAKRRLDEDRAQMAERIDSKVEKHLKSDHAMGMDWRHHHWGKDKDNDKATTQPSGQEGKESAGEPSASGR